MAMQRGRLRTGREVPNLKFDGSELDRLWVLAVALFPNDLPAARRYFAVAKVKAKLDNDSDDKEHVVNARTLRLLLEAPSYASLGELSAANTKRAIVAGDVLMTLYVMKRFALSEPSMNKAIFVAMEYAKKAKYGDSTSLAISEPTIRKCWEEYRPVAHLWAAYRVNKAYPYAPQRSEFSTYRIAALLEVAQGMFQFGASYIPKRARPQKPILDRAQCWVLPDTIAARHLESVRQPERLQRILEKYRAPKTRI